MMIIHILSDVVLLLSAFV